MLYDIMQLAAKAHSWYDTYA